MDEKKQESLDDVTITFRPVSLWDLHRLIDETLIKLIRLQIATEAAIERRDREAAFARYLRTGAFE